MCMYVCVHVICVCVHVHMCVCACTVMNSAHSGMIDYRLSHQKLAQNQIICLMHSLPSRGRRGGML